MLYRHSFQLYFRKFLRRVQANEVHISFWFMLISMMSGSVHTPKKNIEALEVARKTIDLAVNAEKVK